MPHYIFKWLMFNRVQRHYWVMPGWPIWHKLKQFKNMFDCSSNLCLNPHVLEKLLAWHAQFCYILTWSHRTGPTVIFYVLMSPNNDDSCFIVHSLPDPFCCKLLPSVRNHCSVGSLSTDFTCCTNSTLSTLSTIKHCVLTNICPSLMNITVAAQRTCIENHCLQN